MRKVKSQYDCGHVVLLLDASRLFRGRGGKGDAKTELPNKFTGTR